MAWFKTKKNQVTETSNRAIEQKLDRIIELLKQLNSSPDGFAKQVSSTERCSIYF